MTFGYRRKAKPNLVYKGRMDKFADAYWLIWSNKWGCWYRPDSAGYTSDIAQAGIYTREQAVRHYDGPGTPKKYRDTEPFPISAVRRHIDLCERDVEAEYAQNMARVAKLRDALNASPTPTEDSNHVDG